MREIIFYAHSKPVRIAVHVLSEEGAPADVFRKRLKAFYDYLDRDGDGFLSPAEADFALSKAGMKSLIESGFAYPSPNDDTRTFAKFDADGDGKISFAEFAAYYDTCETYLVADRAIGQGDPYAEEITREFFERLDANKDGRLSREELAVLPSWIAKYDRDEDDCLSIDEIIPDIFSRRGAEEGKSSTSGSLRIERAGKFSESAIETLMLRYDRNRNLRLKQSDIGFDAATFRKLDKNSDGTLSMFELAEWRSLPFDLEIEMRLDKLPRDSKIAIRKRADGKDYPLAKQVQMLPDGAMLIRIGQQSIRFDFRHSVESGPISRTVDLAGMFAKASLGKDHILASDVASPEYENLRSIFGLADRNSDGRVSKSELETLVKLFDSFPDSTWHLAHSVESSSLFRLLDQNGDGRLSLRELRQAWERLLPLEPSGENYLTPNLVQPQARIYLGRSSSLNRFAVVNPYEVSIAGDGRGPIWFQKLDRNGDGDISLKEFPGTKAEFDRLDLDSDGLISLEEAEAAEKRYRRK